MSVRFGIKRDNLKPFPAGCQFNFRGMKQETLVVWGAQIVRSRPGVTAGGSKTLFQSLSPTGILGSAENQTPSSRLPESMKSTKSIALAACLVSLALVTGCPSDHKNNPTTPPPTTGSAPSSLAGKTLNVSISSGADPFASSGAYAFTPGGDGTSGRYTLTGTQPNTGTYTYTKTGDNTASLVQNEDLNGTVDNSTLTFQSDTTGTIHSTSNKGGSQDGSFTLN
jgi:hypothetical protein